MVVRRATMILDAKNRTGGAFGSVTNSLKTLGAVAAAVGLVQIGRQLVSGFTAAINAAGEQEAAESRLTVALKNTGQASREVREDLIRFAKTQTEISLATETQILSGLAQAKSMGVTNDAAKKLIASSLDYASAMGVEVPTAIRQTIRTLGGLAGELSEVIPALKDLTAEQLRAGGAAEVLARFFEGAGAEGAKTWLGSINNVQAAMTQLRDAFGRSFTDAGKTFLNEVVTPMIKGFTKLIKDSKALRAGVLLTTAAILDFSASLVELANNEFFKFLLQAATIKLVMLKIQMQQFSDAVEEANPITNKYSESLRSAADEMRRLAMEGQQAAEGGLGASNAELSKTDKLLKSLGLSTSSDLSKSVSDLQKKLGEANRALLSGLLSPERYDAVKNKIKELARAIKEEGGLIFNLESIEVVQGSLIEQAEALRFALTGGLEAFNVALEESRDKVKSLGQTIKESFVDIGVNAANQFAGAIVDAATGAKGSMGDFFRRFLRDLAKAIIQALILKAIMSALGFGGGGSGASRGTVIGGGKSRVTIPSNVNVSGSSAFTRANSGFLVPGTDTGVDKIPVLTRPGEAVLPADLTRLLTKAAGTADMEGSSVIEIEIGDNLASFAERLSASVKRGSVRLVATDLRTSRGTI